MSGAKPGTWLDRYIPGEFKPPLVVLLGGKHMGIAERSPNMMERAHVQTWSDARDCHAWLLILRAGCMAGYTDAQFAEAFQKIVNGRRH